MKPPKVITGFRLALALLAAMLWINLLPQADASWKHTISISGKINIADPTNASPTATSLPCYMAEFDDQLSDLSVKLSAGETITLDWQFTNIGTCDWLSDIRLVAGEDNLDGLPHEMPLAEKVIRPGDQVSTTLQAVAPLNRGEYRIHYSLVMQKDNEDQTIEIQNGTAGGLVVVLIVAPLPLDTPEPGALATTWPTSPALTTSTPTPIPNP